MTITDKEKKYILYSVLFALVWFVFVIPAIQSRIETINPYLQFLVFNLATLIFLQIFLKIVILKQKIAWRMAIGITLLFIAIDIWQPPYMVNTLGQVNANVILGTSSSDYMAALIGQSIGLSGLLLYLFAYLFIPALLLVIAGFLIKDFVREL